MDSSSIESPMETTPQASYQIISYRAQALPEAYRNMIYAKWMRSLRTGNDYFKLIQPRIYYDVYNQYIKSILARPLTIVRLAVLSDDPDVVLGFSVSEDSHILHYCHVHTDSRNQGIGSSLVPFQVAVITHITKIGLSIWNSKYPDAIFNPFQKEIHEY